MIDMAMLYYTNNNTNKFEIVPYPMNVFIDAVYEISKERLDDDFISKNRISESMYISSYMYLISNTCIFTAREKMLLFYYYQERVPMHTATANMMISLSRGYDIRHSILNKVHNIFYILYNKPEIIDGLSIIIRLSDISKKYGGAPVLNDYEKDYLSEVNVTYLQPFIHNVTYKFLKLLGVDNLVNLYRFFDLDREYKDYNMKSMTVRNEIGKLKNMIRS